jgi:Helicase C-terminal domain
LNASPYNNQQLLAVSTSNGGQQQHQPQRKLDLAAATTATTTVTASSAFPGPFRQAPAVSSSPAGGGACSGAILFAVVGGKMSEGINFCDDLARLVAVVGLPFPNANDPELKERMAYLDSTAGKNSFTGAGGGSLNSNGSSSSSPGQEYYENLCMRAVNQSIGRAIRHSKDYATIALLDARYSTPRIRSKLPKWINSRVVQCSTWQPVVPQIQGFFRYHRERQVAAASTTTSSTAGAAAGGGTLVGR